MFSRTACELSFPLAGQRNFDLIIMVASGCPVAKMKRGSAAKPELRQRAIAGAPASDLAAIQAALMLISLKKF
jgi:hypothetical protein